MKVFVDQDRCMASGQCALIADDVFGQRAEDGIATVLDDSPSDDRRPDVEDAAAGCPALAITLEG
ncbi:ferredoxin [Kribbella sp. NPDC004875]|uniref:ferredoxin n=1 Tax=Kribbella sp. NPDC004875 TaxID=3364107 RepID=UPI0036AD3000